MSLYALIAFVQVCVSPPDTLHSSLPKFGGLFGVAVAQWGDRIVVGANREFASQGSGAVYVFELSSGSWLEQARLEWPTLLSSPAELGSSVACDGSRIVAGAPDASAGNGYYGQAIVWRQSGTSWVVEVELGAPQDPGEALRPTREFGRAVALSGDTVLIGAPGLGTTSTPTRGSVFVYRRSGQSWSLEATLQASDSSLGDHFGGWVALEGDLAVIGAANAPGQETDAGAAYVFTRSGSTWTQQQKLAASDGKTGDAFGVVLALDGDTLVITATRRAHFYADTRAAYVFELSGGSWVERQLLLPADPVYGAKLFGSSIALEGDVLLVGAPMQFTQLPLGGGFHLFTDTPNGWIEHLQISAPGARGADQVGRSLSVQGSRLVVGAGQFDGGVVNSGAAFVYTLQASNPVPTYYCSAKQDSQGCTPIIHHDGMPSVSAAVGGYHVSAHLVRVKTAGAFLYSLTGASAAPFAGGTLCIAPPLKRTGGMTSGGTVGCYGAFAFDFQARIASGIDPALVPGQDVWFQYWYRDSGGPPGQEVGLTAAIHAQICP